MAKVEFIGHLSNRIGYRSICLKLSKPTQIKKAMEFPVAEEDVIIMVDGKIGNLESYINDLSSVIVMPAMSGG